MSGCQVWHVQFAVYVSCKNKVYDQVRKNKQRGEAGRTCP